MWGDFQWWFATNMDKRHFCEMMDVRDEDISKSYRLITSIIIDPTMISLLDLGCINIT